MDGTLYKTEDVSVEAIKSALKDLGAEVPNEEKIKSLFGIKMENICKILMPESTREEREQLTERIRHYERIFIPEKAELYKGMKNVLLELNNSNFTLAVCSNGYTDYINLILKTLSVLDLFTYIKGKHPEKSKGEQLKEIIDEANPDFAVMIGDRSHDIKAARENNIPSIGVSYGYGEKEVKEANYIAKTPEDILKFVREEK